MDEDEEADREAGGRKISDRLAFSCCTIPICKQCFSRDCEKAFSTLKSSYIGGSFTDVPVHSAPFSSRLDRRLMSATVITW